jgi:hypothetical protein
MEKENTRLYYVENSLWRWPLICSKTEYGMSEWMNEWMNERLNEWMNERMNEWMNERMNEWIIEWMKEWMNDWMNEWTNDWMNEWMGWMNEWMNEWVNEWYSLIENIVTPVYNKWCYSSYSFDTYFHLQEICNWICDGPFSLITIYFLDFKLLSCSVCCMFPSG